MKKELERLVKKYSLEELVELNVLLGEEVVARVQALNNILGLNSSNHAEAFVKTCEVTNNVATQEATKEEVKENTKEASKVTKGDKPWNTKEMPKIGKYNKVTKEYEYFETKEEGLLTAVTSNKNKTLLGGQVAHNGRIYNYVFSNKYELPVVYGPVSKEFLANLKESILNNLPKDFVLEKPLDNKYKSHYGYEGRFFYDQLEEGKFIYKTKDGYKGFTDEMSFRVLSHEDPTTHKEVIDAINVLSVNYYFSANYENAFSERQKRLYPTLIDNIKDLITKVNNRFNGLDKQTTNTSKYGSLLDKYFDNKDKEKAVVKDTKDNSHKGGLLDGLIDEVEEVEEEVVDVKHASDDRYKVAAENARRAIWND